MATTITIPLTALQVGSQIFGPATVGATDSLMVLSVDRTTAKGATQPLNGQPATTAIELDAEYSPDGGTTWFLLVGTTFPGGTYTNPNTHQLLTADSVQSELGPYRGNQVRARVTVTGAAVAVQGTLTIS